MREWGNQVRAGMDLLARVVELEWFIRCFWKL
jgi:hypothetical protein